MLPPVPLFSVPLNWKFFSRHEESASSASSLCLGVSVVKSFAAPPLCASVSPCLIWLRGLPLCVSRFLRRQGRVRARQLLGKNHQRNPAVLRAALGALVVRQRPEFTVADRPQPARIDSRFL